MPRAESQEREDGSAAMRLGGRQRRRVGASVGRAARSSASAQSPRRRSLARNRAMRPLSFIVVPPGRLDTDDDAAKGSGLDIRRTLSPDGLRASVDVRLRGVDLRPRRRPPAVVPRRSPASRGATRRTARPPRRPRPRSGGRTAGARGGCPPSWRRARSRRRRAAPTRGRPRRSSTGRTARCGIRATPAGKLMNVRTIGSSRPMNTVALPCCWKNRSASSISCWRISRYFP